MIIDRILDRADGCFYDSETFYREVMEYDEIGWDITRAMDCGTEEEVKAALSKYIIEQGYNQEICNYINANKWL